ncbi:unnamed protein product [Penicillium salamii]|uniref:Uncharacterized protein n=1 Tax=Penicillium salamii TaxID=1612424 RepID=A0A9W4IUP0_9EURO|nr:unnamed protein product [Penicillium salamii]
MSDLHLLNPMCPRFMPFIFQPDERVKHLRKVLNTNFGQTQRVNIEALIHIYEIGDLGPRQSTDPLVFLVDGVRVETDPWKDESVPAHAVKWCEGAILQQMTQLAFPVRPCPPGCTHR